MIADDFAAIKRRMDEIDGVAAMRIDARGAQIGVADQIAAAIRVAAPNIVGAAVGRVRRNLAPMMPGGTFQANTPGTVKADEAQ